MTNAFPLVPEGHEHNGIWLTVSHSASMPQVPLQGLRQRDRIHARVGEQSESARHSGRQPKYGSPRRPGSHSHDAAAPLI